MYIQTTVLVQYEVAILISRMDTLIFISIEDKYEKLMLMEMRERASDVIKTKLLSLITRCYSSIRC